MIQGCQSCNPRPPSTPQPIQQITLHFTFVPSAPPLPLNDVLLLFLLSRSLNSAPTVLLLVVVVNQYTSPPCHSCLSSRFASPADLHEKLLPTLARSPVLCPRQRRYQLRICIGPPCLKQQERRRRRRQRQQHRPWPWRQRQTSPAVGPIRTGTGTGTRRATHHQATIVRVILFDYTFVCLLALFHL